MSTTFYRDIELNDGSFERVELNRDGFNVLHRYPMLEGIQFIAQRSSNFFACTDEWEYQDNSDPKLGQAFHKAVFQTEQDATDYMFWRIEKHLNRQLKAGIGND